MKQSRKGGALRGSGGIGKTQVRLSGETKHGAPCGYTEREERNLSCRFKSCLPQPLTKKEVGAIKEIKEEILVIVPVTVYYDTLKAREIAIKKIVDLHLDICSSEGYRAKINKKGWIAS